ncbi:hypothetical protein [Kitasatospora mediocidica]|uniref:hypothetical protein n=1 Tax=Kitasatospora mediocidica TaxID=58352 RepID=UPI000563EB6F|nr:hypothetical protein [Kitasatospora mediocidica]
MFTHLHVASGYSVRYGASLPDAAGLHLYPDVAAVLDQAVRPDTAGGAPVLLPAMTTTSYRWR